VPESVTKHVFTEGQLTPESPAVVMRVVGLQLAPPSAVLITLPWESTATHTLVVGQLMLVSGRGKALEVHVLPPSVVDHITPLTPVAKQTAALGQLIVLRAQPEARKDWDQFLPFVVA
jgi:hypothetical protein